MEKLSLTLNYKGEDVSVEVDMETANIILNGKVLIDPHLQFINLLNLFIK